MGRLTTHVLDTASGRPAAGMKIGLFRIGEARDHLRSAVTNADGRIDAPLLEAVPFTAGLYEIVFDVGSYYEAAGTTTFYEDVAIRFRVADADAHYHVPLLISPFGYSTYRGS